MNLAVDGKLPASNQQSSLNTLLFSVGVSNFDRFVINPMLIALASSFDLPISQMALVVTVYFIAYGLGQMIWGILSDRFGRIAIVRIALTGAIVGSMLSALAPNLASLIIARGLTGAFCGAIIPATISYIGDTITVENRQKSLADMLASMAIGSALATCLAGFTAQFASWRIALALTALLSLGALWRFRNVQGSLKSGTGKSPLLMLKQVFGSPWACLLMVLALVEGAIVLGLFALLPTAMQQQGLASDLAGCVAALYGISVLLVSRTVRHLARSPLIPMSLGGLCLIIGCLLPACFSGLIPLACTAALFGATWTLFHSSLQTWMTTTVPAARATAVAAMITALFLGSALGTSIAGPLVEAHDVPHLFLMASAAATILVVVSIAARQRYKMPL